MDAEADRFSKGLSDLQSVLESLFEMNQHRVEKTTVLYRLAFQNAAEKRGMIVELGAYHGMSTIALCYGATVGDGGDLDHPTHVHTVDMYQDFSGWAGEKYSRSDYEQFLINRDSAKVNPVLHIARFNTVANEWSYRTGLIFWDAGAYSLRADWDDWGRHLPVGGVFAIHDTDEGVLGTPQIVSVAVRTGMWRQKVLDGGITILMRL